MRKVVNKIRSGGAIEYLFLFFVVILSILLTLISKTEYSSVLYRLSPFINNSTTLDISNTSPVNEEIVQLKQQIIEYKLLLNQSRMDRDENIKLRSLLQLKDSLKLSLIPIKVTGYTNSSYKSKINGEVYLDTLDLKGFPVIGINGAVGVVESQMGGDLSIKLINSPKFKISVVTQNRGYPALLIPKNESYGYLKELTKTREIAIGETLFTSSFGTIFPSDIPVATITSYHDDEATIGKKVEVKFIENLLSLNTLFIVRGIDEDL